jgi:histidinol-phosphate aminotransferase
LSKQFVKGYFCGMVLKPTQLIRRSVRRLHAYVPGEQPRIKGLIKLNTNENPYPPSPAVMEAVARAADARLRLYPDPRASALREKLAELHRCKPANVIVGNGSDELLALATRAFVEPLSKKSREATRPPQCTIQYLTPSYSLYPVLAEIHGAAMNAVPLGRDFSLPAPGMLQRWGWDFHAALTFVTTPNAPGGRGYSTNELDILCDRQRGVTILDEAYVDFAEENAMTIALKRPHVLVSRTFSKAYSLCFQRVGYFVGHPELIEALDKIRDSYNVNGLGQVAACATLDHLPYYRRNFKRVIATRERLAFELVRLGFDVFPSAANFLLVRPPLFSAKTWLEKLRGRKILVRWFSDTAVNDYLRITVGADSDADALIRAARSMARGSRS